MSWSSRRRVIIVALLLSAFSIFVVIPYMVLHYEPPTCFDNKKNQHELGVDCGGECSLLCKGMAEDPKVLWTRIFPVRDGVYDIISYIENPNIHIAARTIPYVARLFNAQGEIIAERRGETFAGPNERFAVFEGGIGTGNQIPVRGEMTFSTDIAWRTADIPKLPFSITDKKVTDPDKSPRLTAVLRNNGEETLRDVSVTAIVYDMKGNPIGASMTKVEKVVHNDVAKLSFTWQNPFRYDAQYETCSTPVDVMLALDRSGSMNSDGKNPPQPLTQAIDAAAQFVGSMTSQDQVGYVSFATHASNPVDEALTRDFERVKNTILKTTIGTDGTQYTNIGEAIARVGEEFHTQRRNEDARAVLVLLTDGTPTFPKDSNDPAYATKYAKVSAAQIKNDGATIYTIGLGDEVNGALLKELASSPENYYPAATGAELSKIYQTIATSVCQKGPSVIEIIPRINNVPTSP